MFPVLNGTKNVVYQVEKSPSLRRTGVDIIKSLRTTHLSVALVVVPGYNESKNFREL